MQPAVEVSQETSWRKVLNSASSHTVGVARMWLAYTLFYWLIPTLIILFGLRIANKPFNVLNLIIHGELLIYSITLVAGSTRLITKDLPSAGPFVNRQAFNLVSHIMIFPAIFVYGLIRYIGLTSDPNAVNKPLIVSYSVLLLISAFAFSYIVFVIDAQRSSPGDVQKRATNAIEHSADQLNDDFDVLQGKQNDFAAQQLNAQFDALQGGQ